MAWELSKENYQPLRGGRDPQVLSESSASGLAKSEALDEQKRQLNADIENYSGPDPLEPWLRLVKWTQEQFKAGGHQAELLPLLERCTRELQDKDSYKDDIRYLRIWIQYADCLPEPKDVFLFLIDNNIGQDLALFYIAYAAYLELRGNYARAEAVFQAGRDKMALPVQKLQAKFDGFKERMARRHLRQLRDEADLGAQSPLTEEQPAAGREALGVLKSKTRHTGLATRPSQPQAATNNKENSEASGLDIYVDDDLRDAGARSTGLGAQSTGGWDNLASFESTRKENQQRPGKWKGNKFKQRSELMPVPDPSLEIPVDEELQDVQPVFQKAPKGTLQQRAGIGRSRDLEERLQRDPLQLFKDPSKAHKARAEQPIRNQVSATSSRPANEESSISASDVSFEELRAEAWTAAKSAEAAKLSKKGHKGSISSSICIETNVEEPMRKSEPASATEKDARSAADVTIATRAAFESVNGMFRGALPHDFSWDGCGDPTGTMRLGEATVTLSSRAAFDAVNSMFQATLPYEGGTAVKRRPSSAATRMRRADSHTSLAHDDDIGGLQVYEDTEFLPRKGRASEAAAAADHTEAFVPYVDTEFLHPSGETAASRLSNARRPAVDQTTDFVVYEDTHAGGGWNGAAEHRDAQSPNTARSDKDQENVAPGSSY